MNAPDTRRVEHFTGTITPPVTMAGAIVVVEEMAKRVDDSLAQVDVLRTAVTNLRTERDNVLPFLIAEKKQSANLAHELDLALHELDRVRDERDELLVRVDELTEENDDLRHQPVRGAW